MIGMMTGTWQRPGRPGRVSPISPSLMAVVEAALSRAWRELLEDVAAGAFSLCSATEDEITEQLQLILGELQAAQPEQVEGFSQFSLSRDGKVRNCDGQRLDLQPDLAFYPLRGSITTTNSMYAAIFAECKPVDSGHPVGDTYYKEGLARFIRGDYAWAVDRALMVGYVRNRCWLPDGLLVGTEEERASGAYRFRGVITELLPTLLGDRVFQSNHERSCQLALQPAGPIAVHHLWLHPRSPCEEKRCKGVLSAKGARGKA